MKLVKVFVVFLVFIYARGVFQYNRSCRRNRTCISIEACPDYMILWQDKPIHSHPAWAKAKKHLCQIIDAGKYQTYKVCCPQPKGKDLSNHNNYHLLPMDTCGPVPVDKKIIQGGNAAPREFPWMALIAYETGDSPDDQDFKCGGSLINERYILTAAHCLDDQSVLGVRLGEYDISLERECYNGRSCEPPVQDIGIDKIIIHEDYSPSATYKNDIGLIRLSKPADMNRANVKPICLPTEHLRQNLVGKFLTVTGWGINETGHRSMVLSKVSFPVVPLDKCRQFYGAVVTKTQICAGGYKGRDSCSGDSGGPLQSITPMGQSERYVEYGIVSYGPKQCGVDGWPSVYTNVRQHMAWILDNLEP